MAYSSQADRVAGRVSFWFESSNFRLTSPLAPLAALCWPRPTSRKRRIYFINNESKDKNRNKEDVHVGFMAHTKAS